MADYQKKNVKKLKAVKPKKKTVAENYKLRAFDESKIDEDIPVKSAEQAKTERKFEKQKQRYLKKEQPKKRIVFSDKTPSELNSSASSFRVLAGTKRLKIIKRIFALAVTFGVIATVLILHFISPTGLSERISNTFAKMGSGTGFPVMISGGTVYDIKNFNDCIAIVSDTYFEIYNSDSKEIISEQHGLSEPVLSVSHERALIYDRNGKDLAIYNLSGSLSTKTMSEEIVTAAIGKNGTFAIVTDPDKSASKLYVYNKADEELLSWQSEEGIINSIAVSHSGKTVAVSMLKASGGAYRSDVAIFDVETGEKRKTAQYSELVYSVESCGNGYIVCSDSGLYGIAEETGNEEKLSSKTVLYSVASARDGFAAVFGIKDSDNNIEAVIYGEDNAKLYEGELNAVPDYLAIDREYFAYSADNHIYVKNLESDEEMDIDSDLTAGKFVIADGQLFVLNNSVLECVEIEDTEENK